MEDGLFYFLHRLLHHPRLYAALGHKRHHEFKVRSMWCMRERDAAPLLLTAMMRPFYLSIRPIDQPQAPFSLCSTYASAFDFVVGVGERAGVGGQP